VGLEVHRLPQEKVCVNCATLASGAIGALWTCHVRRSPASTSSDGPAADQGLQSREVVLAPASLGARPSEPAGARIKIGPGPGRGRAVAIVENGAELATLWSGADGPASSRLPRERSRGGRKDRGCASASVRLVNASLQPAQPWRHPGRRSIDPVFPSHKPSARQSRLRLKGARRWRTLDRGARCLVPGARGLSRIKCRFKTKTRTRIRARRPGLRRAGVTRCRFAARVLREGATTLATRAGP